MASNLRAIVHTNANSPSKSLIKRICYPEACKFVSTATAWGCQHEVDAVQDFWMAFFLSIQMITVVWLLIQNIHSWVPVIT